MTKILNLLLLMVFYTGAYAQVNINGIIDSLMTAENYSMVVDKYAGENIDEYSAKSLFDVGFSYYMLENDNGCIRYMDLAIAKDSTIPSPYFIKASAYIYMDKLEEAIPLLLKVISLESDKLKLAHSYRSLGYSYLQLKKYELALKAYNNSIDYDSITSISYAMIAQIYSDLNQKEKSLETYYKGKENVSKQDEKYIDILFNIGLMEQLRGDYKNAEIAYRELLEISPNDYHTCAKLIQVYNHNKEYDKVLPLKEKLYSAHRSGAIDDENLLDMFCIEQFVCKNKEVKVFERYEEGDSKKIYNKILFYILDETGELDFRIQTEYSPIAVSLGEEARYILCANKDGAHINYGIGFNDNSTYESIKNTVVAILEKEIE